MKTRPTVRRLGTFLLGIGLDPRKMIAAIRAIPHYVRTMVKIRQQLRVSPEAGRFRLVPTLSDLYSSSGVANGHYFHQDLWAAREIFERQPRRHCDVGSRIDGFVAHLLCFREVEVFDIRSLTSKVRGLRFVQADMMQTATSSAELSDSVSCLHALEHFGLGRYGDPVDLDGWTKGLANLACMTSPAGVLYLSVPVGKPVIEFNAQRIFAAATVVAQANLHGLRLESFSIIDDAGDFHSSVDLSAADELQFACGCFLFVKN